MAADNESIARLNETLSKYAPASAIARLSDHIVRRGIHIRITSHRSSKYGDYRCPAPSHPYHAISVNGNLTPEFFLLVMLHELAHLETYVLFHRSVQPHGHEWQRQYRDLLLDYRNCFPLEAQPLIDRYTRRIPLHGPTGKSLDRLLQNLGAPVETKPTLLNDLSAGSVFRLANRPQRLFVCIEKRRTRWLCRELRSYVLVTISGDAPVIVEKQS